MAKGKSKKYGSGGGKDEDCVFPFKHAGKKYMACALGLAYGDGPWCATKVDSDGNMQNGKWARCNEMCATHVGDKIGVLIKILLPLFTP